MDNYHIIALGENYQELVNSIPTENVVDMLVSADVFTTRDKHIIKCIDSPRGKRKQVLARLMQSSPPSIYLFCKALDDSGCQDMASRVRWSAQPLVYPLADKVTVATEERLDFHKELGGATRLKILYSLQGEPRIDIRHWTLVQGDKVGATKRGILLTLQRWVSLLWMRVTIDAALQKVKNNEQVVFKTCVGGPIFVLMTSPLPLVNLREYYVDTENNQVKLSNRGILLRPSQWTKMMACADDLEKAIPKIKDILPCNLFEQAEVY